MASLPLVVTGFGPFPGVERNPTADLIESLACCADPLLAGAETYILPTRYGEAPDALASGLAANLAENAPVALIMTGYSHRAPGVVIERRASNLCHPDKPDSGGAFPRSTGGPEHLLDACGCDTDALATAVRVGDLQCELSDDAGGYVCNHLYFNALSQLSARPGSRAVFVHLPAIEGTPLARVSAAALSLQEMQQALGIIARALLYPSGKP